MGNRKINQKRKTLNDTNNAAEYEPKCEKCGSVNLLDGPTIYEPLQTKVATTCEDCGHGFWLSIPNEVIENLIKNAKL